MNFMQATLRKVWAAWVALLHRIGNFQARLLLTVLYVVLLAPFGLLVRLFSDPLRIKNPPDQWQDRPQETFDMRWARRQ